MKRFKKILIWIFSISLLLFILFRLTLKNSKVQSYLTDRAVNYFQKKLKTKVSIESVDFEFIKTFVFNGIYIEDQSGDTLTYINQLKFDINSYNFSNNHYALEEISMSRGFINLNKTFGQDSIYNFEFILEAFKTEKNNESIDYKINCKKIVLDNFRFRHKTPLFKGDKKLFDYNDIDVKNLSIKVLNTLISPKLIACKLKFCQFKDKSGLELRDFFGYFSMDEKSINLEEFEINSNHSELDGDIKITLENKPGFFENTFDITLNEATNIDYQDLGFFLTPFQNIKYDIDFSGHFTGNLNRLIIQKFLVNYGNNSHIFLAGVINKINKRQDLSYQLNLRNFVTDYEDLIHFPTPYLKVTLPSYLSELGVIQCNGNAEGSVKDFSTEIDLFTEIGNSQGDFNFHLEDSGFVYSGGINLSNTNLPKALTGTNKVEQITGQFDFFGDYLNNRNTLKSTGIIGNITINNHRVKPFISTITLKNNELEILLEDSSNHKNISILTKIDLRETKSLESKITLKKFDINQLGLLYKSSPYKITAFAEVQIEDIKNIFDNASIHISDLELWDVLKSVKSKKIDLVSQKNEGLLDLKLSSDILDFSLNGNVDVLDLPKAFDFMAKRTFPELFDSTQVKSSNCDLNFDFSIQSKNLQSLLGFVGNSYSLTEPLLVNGHIGDSCNTAVINISLPSFEFKDQTIYGIEFNLDFGDTSSFKMELGNYQISDSIAIKEVELDIEKVKSNIDYTISWNNHTIPYTNGSIAGIFKVKNKNRFENTFKPSQFTIADSVWRIIDNNHIQFYPDTIIINSLVIKHKDQILGIDGLITENPKDKLDIIFEKFKLELLNPFLRTYGINLSGVMDGNLSIFQPTKNIVIDSDLRIKELAVNEYNIGNGNIETTWNTKDSKLTIAANFIGFHQNSIDLNGFYLPQKKTNNLGVELKLNRFELATMNEFLEGTVSNLKGKLTGGINIEGSIENPEINGSFAFSETEFVINYLNTKYKLGRDKIDIKSSDALIESVSLIDAYGNIALVNGKITHDHFKNIKYDIELTNEGPFQYLNTNSRINSSYYGQAFLDRTKINLSGSNQNTKIDVKARTAHNTQFNIPLSNPEEITESGFITFVNLSDERQLDNTYHSKIQDLQMNFDLEITDEAKVQIIFDEKVGDIIRTTGNGNMRMEITNLGKFNLFGEYEIVKGDYLFTLQNIINKKFDIVPSSNIIWNGSPYSALLDIKTIYRLKAPLSDIMSSIDSSNSFNRRIPVDCYLKLANELTDPKIEFDIQLPSTDNEILDAFNALISKEGEINRQFFSLLVLNRFIAPDNESSLRSNVGATNSTEMLSHQISNWLSKISSDFDVGFKYLPGDEISDEEIELALSTQLFNDRLSIEGNFGVSGNNTTTAEETNNLVGDVLVEYKVKKDGSISLKAYNSSNEYNIVDATTSKYTQGVGVLFRKDFNTFGELFKSIFKFGTKEEKVRVKK